MVFTTLVFFGSWRKFEIIYDYYDSLEVDLVAIVNVSDITATKVLWHYTAFHYSNCKLSILVCKRIWAQDSKLTAREWIHYVVTPCDTAIRELSASKIQVDFILQHDLQNIPCTRTSYNHIHVSILHMPYVTTSAYMYNTLFTVIYMFTNMSKHKPFHVIICRFTIFHSLKSAENKSFIPSQNTFVDSLYFDS